MRLSEALVRGQRALGRHAPSARLDCEVLLAHVIGCSRAEIYARISDHLAAPEVARFDRLVGLRKRGWPIAYLTGHQAAGQLHLQVDPRVLIPRPSTELLIEAVRQAVGAQPVTIADIGTGSGLIVIHLAKQLPHAKLEASDISPGALAVARTNAEDHGVADRIRWRFGSLLEPWFDELEPEVIVANLPYLPPDQLRHASIRHEPKLALYGGRDGLRQIYRLVQQLWLLPLVERVALECLPAQVDTVAYWLRQVKPTGFRTRPILDGSTAWGVWAERT